VANSDLRVADSIQPRARGSFDSGGAERRSVSRKGSIVTNSGGVIQNQAGSRILP
jgi:hypothetical protein